MTLRNYNVMDALKPPKLMTFRTSPYFHENTLVVLRTPTNSDKIQL